MHAFFITPVRSGRQVLAALLLAWAAGAPGQELSTLTIPQYAAVLGSKPLRTAAEAKLDSTLLYAARASRSAQTQGAGAVPVPEFVQAFVASRVARDGSTFVVIHGDVSDALLADLAAQGATDMATFPQFQTVTAHVPIAAVLAIAQHPAIRSIGPREEYTTQRYIQSPEEARAQHSLLAKSMAKAGSVQWQGVAAHQADKAVRAGIDGTGVRVCVLSDGVDSLALRKASGDIPATTTVLAGQAGTGDEGTAMLEIVHDMAPGAALVFATGDPSVAQMATNIQNLRTVAGCDIIVDDITYFNEGAFQDGPIAQAVNTVTASGALYFSSAANSGNLTHGSSGTWEGDFVASGAAVPAAIAAFEGAPVALHSFGALPYITLTAASPAVSLKWSDPLGASANDYDLIVMDSTGTNIIGASGAVQSGIQDPFEAAICNACTYPVGSRIYVALFSGSARALRIDTNRGRLSGGTSGSTFGHNAAGSAFSVAAVNVGLAGGGAFVGGAGNPVDTYSSDGPRKLFYTPAGAAITPGNLFYATNGGTTLAKVDLAASDCGSTATAGFTSFCGTSAAAPTAASIAALVKSANPASSKAQISAALLASALNIEAAGPDRDSGVGIVMAPAAVRGVLAPLTLVKTFTPNSVAPGSSSTLSIKVTNPNAVALSGIALTDSYPAPLLTAAAGVPAVSGPGCSATLAAPAGGGSFAITSGVVPAGATCIYSVNVAGGANGVFTDASGALTTPIALNSAAAAATLTIATVAPQFTSPAPPPGTAGVPYTHTYNASGVPAAGFALASGALPPGLALDAATGVLSGTPILAGLFIGSVSAGNGVLPDAVQTFSITIAATAPGAPGIGPATAGNGLASIAFTVPVNNGGVPVTGYTATCNPGNVQASGTGSPITVNGLANGTPYTCSVTAANAQGTGAASAPVAVTPSAAAPFAVTAVVSRKVHGAAGTFDMAIDTTQSIAQLVTVEPRAIGAGHSIVFQFSGPVTSVASASAVDGAAQQVGTATAAFAGNEVVVTLTGIPDDSRATIGLTGVNGALATAVSLGFLVGDVNNTRSVNSSDISGVKARSGQTTDGSNFRFDLNASGAVNSSDISAVKARSGEALP